MLYSISQILKSVSNWNNASSGDTSNRKRFLDRGVFVNIARYVLKKRPLRGEIHYFEKNDTSLRPLLAPPYTQGGNKIQIGIIY